MPKPNCRANGCCGVSLPWCEWTGPHYGEKDSYYPAVCLETGEVEWMEVVENSNSETSAALLAGCCRGTSGRWTRSGTTHRRPLGSPSSGERVAWRGYLRLS